MSRYKHHSCLASAVFACDQNVLRAAFIRAVDELPSFAIALTAYDFKADLEVEFHTPAKWLDVISISFEESGDSVLVNLFSKSTNLCPNALPWKIFRCCCDCMRLFQDNGENKKHVCQLISKVEEILKLDSNLDILYTSKQ
jgi:hypothetical protein